MGRDGDGECKDFAKGVCFRGASCKYRHVGDKQDPDTVPFCKDFQSDRGCNYESDNGRSCAFVHAPRAATEEYYRTGWLPGAVVQGLAERFQLCRSFLENQCNRDDGSCKYKHIRLGIDLGRGGGGGRDGDQAYGAGYDQIMRKFGICRDYAKGACQSDAQSCRYKHRSPMDLDIGNERTTWEDVRAREEALAGGYRGDRGMMGGGDDWGDRRMGSRGPPGPSPWMDRGDHRGPPRGGWDGPSDGWEGGMGGRGGGMKRMRMDDMGGGGGDLRLENQQLMAENQELRRKVEELTVTNKFLLDLNAEMRLGGGGPAGGSGMGTGGGIGGSTGYSSGGPGYGGGAVFSTGGGSFPGPMQGGKRDRY